MEVNDTIWQDEEVTQNYLIGVRGAIPLAQEQMDVMLRLIHFSQESVTAVLDLGCGDGILGQIVLDQFPEATATFVDFSEPMFTAAQQRLLDYEDRATIANADYGNRDWRLEIEDEQYDVIVSGFSIHHQPDGRKQELYAELFELLKPGGIFINIEHVASHSKWGEMMFEDALTEAIVAYHKQIGSQETRANIVNGTVNSDDREANILAPVEIQCDWLRKIGFIHVDCYLKYFELALFAGVKPN